MAIQQILVPQFSTPELLGEPGAAELAIFLSADIPSNLFQLSWLENYGIDSPRGADAFIFVGVRTPHGKLAAVMLLVGQSLALIHSQEDGAAEAIGRWCRDRGFQLDHIVSARHGVEVFWRAYAAEREILGNADSQAPVPRTFAQLRAHSHRAQTRYMLERARWHDAQAQRDPAAPAIHPRPPALTRSTRASSPARAFTAGRPTSTRSPTIPRGFAATSPTGSAPGPVTCILTPTPALSLKPD